MEWVEADGVGLGWVEFEAVDLDWADVESIGSEEWVGFTEAEWDALELEAGFTVGDVALEGVGLNWTTEETNGVGISFSVFTVLVKEERYGCSDGSALRLTKGVGTLVELTERSSDPFFVGITRGVPIACRSS